MRLERKAMPPVEFSSEKEVKMRAFISNNKLDQPGQAVDRETFEGFCRELASGGPLDFNVVQKRISVIVGRIGWLNRSALQTVDVGRKLKEAKPPAPAERVKLLQALSNFRFAQGIDRRGDVWPAVMLERFARQFSSSVDQGLVRDIITQELSGTLA